jgi:hypothetical protein
MAEPEHISTILDRVLPEMEKRVDMGGRFVISGVQLGMIKGELKVIDSSIGGEMFKDIFAALEEIYDKQHIGQSENLLDDDINDLTNLFASWLGKASTDTENEIFDSYFTLYWLGGKREVVKGTDIADAMNHAGYGHGALKALDFHCKGIDYDYEWNSETKEWDRKEKDETDHQ